MNHKLYIYDKGCGVIYYQRHLLIRKEGGEGI